MKYRWLLEPFQPSRLGPTAVPEHRLTRRYESTSAESTIGNWIGSYSRTANLAGRPSLSVSIFRVEKRTGSMGGAVPKRGSVRSVENGELTENVEGTPTLR